MAKTQPKQSLNCLFIFNLTKTCTVATFKFSIAKSITAILNETVMAAQNGRYDILQTTPSGVATEITDVTQIPLDREWNFDFSDISFYARASGTLRPLNGGLELSWTGYGFAQDPPYYRLTGGKTGPTQVTYTGAWNGLCSSQLMPEGIDHPLSGSGSTCRVSGVTGFPEARELSLAQYLSHRIYNAEWIRVAGPKAAEAIEKAQHALDRAEHNLASFDEDEEQYQAELIERYGQQAVNSRRKVVASFRLPLTQAVEAASNALDRAKFLATSSKAPEPGNLLKETSLVSLVAAVKAAIASPSKETWQAAHAVRHTVTDPRFSSETLGRTDLVGAVKAALLNL